jgi:hypothetical protein
MPVTVAWAQTQTTTEVATAPAKTGDESDDRKRIGYFTAAAVAVGVALNNRGSSHGSQSIGNLTSRNTGATARHHNYDIPSSSPDFASTGSGTVLVTSLPQVDNATGSGFDGDATTINDAAVQTAAAPSLAGSPFNFSPADFPHIGNTNMQNSAVSLLPSTSNVFTSLDSARTGSAAVAMSSPEPGEWIAMGMMGLSVLGLMARAKRAKSARASHPIT